MPSQLMKRPCGQSRAVPLQKAVLKQPSNSDPKSMQRTRMVEKAKQQESKPHDLHSVLQCLAQIRSYLNECSTASLMQTAQFVYTALQRFFPGRFTLISRDGCAHSVCLRTCGTSLSLALSYGKSSYAKFWFNGSIINRVARVRVNNMWLHSRGITHGSKVYETVQIFLKTLGGDTVLLNVPLQVLTVGQLRKAFVEKVCTVRRGIGVAKSFGCRWGTFLPAGRRSLVGQRGHLLQQPTRGDNYRFIFAGSILDDTQLLSDCGVETESTLHVAPRWGTPELYALLPFLPPYD